MGVDPVAKIVWPRIYEDGTVKTHFSRLMARPLVSRDQMEKVCLPVRRTQTGVIHVCKHPFMTFNGAVHHALKGLCSVRQPKRHEQILKQAKWRDNCRFWDVCCCNRDLVITIDKINF
jgi:hypothetical protein